MNIHVRYAGDWTELATLKPGALFETQDGLRYALTSGCSYTFEGGVVKERDRFSISLTDGWSYPLNAKAKVREIQLRDVVPDREAA